MLHRKEISVHSAGGTSPHSTAIQRVRAGAFTLAALALLTALFAASALADTGDIVAPSDPNNPTKDSGWQAGTCNNEPPEAGGTASEYCSIETKKQFFEQAAGHPQWGFTQIIVKHKTQEPIPGTKLEEPEGELKTVRVDLPVGLSVNPQATVKQCPQADFEANPSLCAGSEVGESLVWGAVPGVGVVAGPLKATVYNIVPVEGEPARFGFNLGGNNIYLRANVAWESDYHEGFTIDVPALPFSALPLGAEGLILKNRLVFNGRAGNGTFVTTPTTCLGPPTVPAFEHVYSTWLRADSYEKPDPNFPNGSTPFESPIPDFTDPKHCDTIPFDPSLEVDPNTDKTDSPSGAIVTVNVPFEVPAPTELADEFTKQASSHLRTAKVTLPAGMGLNPSAANGLLACTDAQFGKGTRHPVECPAASKVGTVAVETPPLPPGSLSGNVYLGQQLSRDPTSGNEYRIFVDVESARYGISARLIGNVAADPQTGQLTTTFAENPQVPVSAFKLQFESGNKAPLTSPPTCGPNTATSQMIPWSSAQGSVPVGQEDGPNGEPPATPSGKFSLASAPAGGKCPTTLAARPFGPSFTDSTAKPKGGAFSPFQVSMTRQDGEQELKGIDVTLPPGLTAKLAGVTYCPESALAAAAVNSGAGEAANPSCPSSSLIGSASVLSGTGSAPIHIDGKAFLTGPYHGAPLSLAVVTPATAGPFDLGSVVVRVALFIDPATAQVHAVSDPIPHVFGGALLDVRSITVKMDRPNFSLNPTNCSHLAVTGALRGGGGNPLDPSAYSSFAVSAPFQVNGCDQLGFGPKLSLRLFGATRRAKNPKLRAIFVTNPGDANPARVSVKLPRALILDQSSISKVCTRVQFAARECPKNSIYGFARAFTPLLDKPLEGPVYMRSSDNPLPDLVAALRGQVEIDLAGRTDTVHGHLRNTFDLVPDVPVSKFMLTVRGGPNGLLTNTVPLCPRKKGHHRHGPSMRVIAKITGQNGKTANQRPLMRTPCKHGKKKHHK